MAKKSLDYDVAYEELQGIMQKLQLEEVGIEAISLLIKRAQELHDFCKNRLRDIESDLQEIKDKD